MCVLAAQQDNEASMDNDCSMSEESEEPETGAADVSGSADVADEAQQFLIPLSHTYSNINISLNSRYTRNMSSQQTGGKINTPPVLLLSRPF